MTESFRTSGFALGVIVALGAIMLLMSGIALTVSADKGTLVDASGASVAASSIAHEVEARITLGVSGLVLATMVLLMLAIRHRGMALPGALVCVGVTLALILSGMVWAWADGTMLVLILMIAALAVLALMGALTLDRGHGVVSVMPLP